MAELTYPGVYIEEIPSGVRTITGVSTSVTAFIDSFPRGLLNEAVQCLSYADFEREFGGLHRDSEASYAIRQFFKNGGTNAWVVRVATLDAAAAADNALESSVTLNDTAATPVLRVRAGRMIRGASAFNPGTWGDDLYLEVDYDTKDPASLFNLKVSEIPLVNGVRRVGRNEVFRNLSMDPTSAEYAVAVVNNGSRLVQIEDLAGVPTARPAASGTIGGALNLAALPAGSAALTVDVGAGAIGLTINYTTVPDAQTLRSLLEQGLRALSSTPGLNDDQIAMLSGAQVRLIADTATPTGYSFQVLAGLGGSNFTVSATMIFAGTDMGAFGFPGAASEQRFQLTGGQDGIVPVDETALIGTELGKTGLYALEDVDLFNILCIPRAADLGETQMQSVYSEATLYCKRRRAFLIIDINETVDALDEMQTWISKNASLRDSNAAVYFPRPFMPDPLNDNRRRSVGASGTVAGLYARTDAARGVWKAPAGIEARLLNVTELPYVLTDRENGTLNPLGVNCFRNLPVYGHTCWGARTLDGADALASEWKYIPIRRLALFLEESLYRGTQWVVFEPNDEPLWAKIRLNIGVFMNRLFRQGAFQGTSPDQAYFVKCDSETTTQADRDLGIVNIIVGFAPLKPAEFVVISIQQIAGDLQ